MTSILLEKAIAEVRKLLGRHIFAVDDETMEDAVGRLLSDQSKTIAVYEDLTGGLVAERLQLASVDYFVQGTVGNSPAAVRRLLARSGRSDGIEELLDDPASLTDELARAVRADSGSDLGLALHAITNPEEQAENLARGQTFISITDGSSHKNRSYAYGGKGRPDRTRMSLNAIELVRIALLEGI